jgi:hypothetical protein
MCKNVNGIQLAQDGTWVTVGIYENDDESLGSTKADNFSTCFSEIPYTMDFISQSHTQFHVPSELIMV